MFIVKCQFWSRNHQLTWNSSMRYVKTFGLYQLNVLSKINISVPSRTLLNVPAIGSWSDGTLEFSKIFSSGLPLHLYSTAKEISPMVVEKLYLHTLPARLGIGNSNLCWTDIPSHFQMRGSFEAWSMPLKPASRASKKWLSDIIATGQCVPMLHWFLVKHLPPVKSWWYVVN